MKIYKFNIDNKNIEFVCDDGNTYNGFYHKVTMFINGCEVSNARVNYINRTWESYAYQTCMKKAVGILFDRHETNMLFEFKDKNGYKKMNNNRWKEFRNYVENNPTLKFYDKIYNEI